MNALAFALVTSLRLSAVAGVFLAFVWPFVVSADPAGGAFRWAATATLVAFLLSLTGVVAVRAARRRAGSGRGG
jgi:hypothetical protein